jgi:hypothetical protein
MKKYIILTVVLALIISASILEKNYIKTTFKEFDGHLTALAGKAYEKSIDDADVNAVKKWWNQKKPKLDLMVPHINITETDLHIAEMSGNVTTKKYEEAYAQISILRELCARITEMLSD